MHSRIKRALFTAGALVLLTLSGCTGSFWYYCGDGDYYEQSRVYGIESLRAFRVEIINGEDQFVPLRTNESVTGSRFRLQVRLDVRYDYIYYDEYVPEESAKWSISDFFISSAQASSCGYRRYDDLLARVTDMNILATPGYTIVSPQTETLTDQSQIIYNTSFQQISEPVRDYSARREYASEQFYLRIDTPPMSAGDYRFTVRIAFDDGYVYERTSAMVRIVR